MSRISALLTVLFVVACAKPQTGGRGDGGGLDLSPSGDASTVDLAQGSDAGPRASFGQPCTTGADCQSSLCYRPNPSDPQGFCSEQCTRDCPNNYECKTVRITDTVDADVCVPAQETFCNPCQVHRDCGDSSDLCVTLPTGRFCSIDCRNDPNGCPPGFDCKALGQVAEFGDAYQCVPRNDICCIDQDGDRRGRGGGCVNTDCNDFDPRIYDDAVEVCDGVDNDCQGGVDVDPTDCQAAGCFLTTLGYFQRAAEPCTGGRCQQQQAVPCGLYTCSGGGEAGDVCATACDGEDDTKCIPPAHCEASLCAADLPNGSACDEASDCMSNHCQNGFCCDTGDCCRVATDCPNFGQNLPVCDDPATCQGSKGQAICNNYRCGTLNGVPDDSACGVAVLANECGAYRPLYCTGATTQTPPTCPSSCTTNAECDDNAYCNAARNCVPDEPDGRACRSAEECTSGHCQNGFCCASGDCCANERDCPAVYTRAAVCTQPTACQGTQDVARCTSSICETALATDNDAACGVLLVANDCGPYPAVYCDGTPTQAPPTCARGCTSNAECDANAYCNAAGQCVYDEPDGHACRAANECVSGHCQSGFCCASGDCCAKSSDCGGYAQAPVCNSQTSCQGTRVDGLCSATFQCSGTTVDDDSACAGLQANDCGPYPPIACTAAQSQPSNQASLCAASCTSDAGCDVSAHCAGGVCVPDVGAGGYCNQANDCSGGLFCVDNVCCNTSCTGLCEACDVPGAVGTCTAIPSGQDPDSECGGVSCAAYYYGFAGDTCYRKADVSAAQASCNGSRACRTVAEECTLQTTRGTAQLTCDSFCQDPTTGTCTATTAGACTNVNQGSTTCGQGVCQVTTPLCINGQPATCTPDASKATTETCNDLDDNCDGTIDNGAFADTREANETCANYVTLPIVGSNETKTETSLTLYPSGDVDYFLLPWRETDQECACCDFFCTREDYYLNITLTVPPGAGAYQICINGTTCSLVTDACNVVSAGQSATFPIPYPGGRCGSVDSGGSYVRISSAAAPGYECRPYTLSYKLVSGVCVGN